MFSSLSSRPAGIRLFWSTARRSDRAIVYSENGDPAKVLRVLTYPSLPPPPPNSVNIRFLLSPINPADINVVEGTYPSKPAKTDILSHKDQSLVVGGNEGLAQVTAVGAGVKDSLRVDDWVIMIKQQAGTWATDRNVAVHDVAKVPGAHVLTESQAATMTVRNHLTNRYYSFCSKHSRSTRLLLTTCFLGLLTYAQVILLSKMVQIVLSVYQL